MSVGKGWIFTLFSSQGPKGSKALRFSCAASVTSGSTMRMDPTAPKRSDAPAVSGLVRLPTEKVQVSGLMGIYLWNMGMGRNLSLMEPQVLVYVSYLPSDHRGTKFWTHTHMVFGSFSTNQLAWGWLKLKVKGTTHFAGTFFTLQSYLSCPSEIESQIDSIPEFIKDGTIYRKPLGIWG